MKAASLLLLLGLFLLPCGKGGAADAVPPAPAAWCNDYAGLLSPAAKARIDGKLRAFERETSTQIVVALFPALPDGGAVEDATYRMAQAWGIGRKGRNNGVVLFLFAKEHRLRIEVGTGLEGVIPDVTAKRIISERITPRLRAGDFDGGIEAGADALISAAKGEPFVGNGKTVGDERAAQSGKRLGIGFLIGVFLIFWVLSRMKVGGGRHYTSSGIVPFGIGSGLGSSLGGGWSRGDGGGGGGGGFSGGGGSFGGGGAGGSW
ncbi:uncharacterized protein SAMN05444156_0276 [Verrucomicrobium sp. GAS474]|uniref:TPM domain-containing protein n=1 Tax=Verrucomicrobium sp. GAS474 TaxID=1882831 RepID=UPI000879B594|nr:TPM domain-containing protein [Verrucomicrobium sp. GAS474]SDT87160.1 uncharacterized protein SAMN05444156_0276 [Verrucomicrobium sp. GAS474]